MIFANPAELRDRIEELSGRTVYGAVQVYEDTSPFMSICGGTVIRLAGRDYFVLGDTTEGRFGIDEQPKFWVKYAIDLTDGAHKIIKLVFHEQFSTRLDRFTIVCLRSPSKESAFLQLVQGDPRFMQGFTVTDPAGNQVRIIDRVRGRSLFNHLTHLKLDHERYYFEQLPQVMHQLIPAIEAMARVHQHGLRHGDIRNDHILVDASAGGYVWIDFDYEVNFSDYDTWCMGNIIAFAVGKGSHTFHRIRHEPQHYPHLTGSLAENDGFVLYRNRVANLRKLFPYISQELNDILMRFSVGTTSFYTDLGSEVRDLRALFPSTYDAVGTSQGEGTTLP